MVATLRATVSTRMTQDEINRAEWQNPANWNEDPLGFYFSKRDSRVFVPKRPPATGWTLNLGHPTGPRWLYGLFLAIILFQTVFFVLLIFKFRH